MTAEKFLQDSLEISHYYNDKYDSMMCHSHEVQKAMIQFAQYHVKQALEAASKKAFIEYELDVGREIYLGNPVVNDDYKYINFDSLPTMTINKSSILESYPEENIL